MDTSKKIVDTNRDRGFNSIVSQWTQTKAPQLRQTLLDLLTLIQARLEIPLNTLEVSAKISHDSSRTPFGIYLDFIGELFGIYRPLVASSTDKVFGFAPEDTSFDQAPFTSANEEYNALVPMNDADYLSLILVKGKLISIGLSVADVKRVYDDYFDNRLFFYEKRSETTPLELVINYPVSMTNRFNVLDKYDLIYSPMGSTISWEPV